MIEIHPILYELIGGEGSVEFGQLKIMLRGFGIKLQAARKISKMKARQNFGLPYCQKKRILT